jgi:hypothetical protein
VAQGPGSRRRREVRVPDHRRPRPLAGALKGELDGICLALYGVDGLFGQTPAEAFATTVGASVNTIDTIAQGELDAVVEARLSLHAKAVNIDLVSCPSAALCRRHRRPRT